MDVVELIKRLEIRSYADGLRVTGRESTDLEFKLVYDLLHFKKCLKTIAAFANRNGGYIVFGVQDKPRKLVGIGNAEIDEAQLTQQVVTNLSPPPDFESRIISTNGVNLAVICVHPITKPPVISLKRIEGGQDEAAMIEHGVIYMRRRGQTSPITSEEFTQLMAKRDEIVMKGIFAFFEKGRSVGFEKAIVATHAPTDANPHGMNFFIPKEAAKDLNIIDRARLVEDYGAPAYQILGTAQLANFDNNDPRIPLLPEQAASSMKRQIEAIFWRGFPWSPSHLKKIATHLGYWQNEDGDQENVSFDRLTNRRKYFLLGREAILNFAEREPQEFVQIVGSQKTIADWHARNNL